MARQENAFTRRCRGGFTLVELLAVIAILVLLFAMLMPSMRNVKEIAIQSKCLNNLRQLGHVASLYSNDNSGSVVPAAIWAGYYLGPNQWTADAGDGFFVVWELLLQYLGAPDPLVYPTHQNKPAISVMNHLERTGLDKQIQCPKGSLNGGTILEYDGAPPPYEASARSNWPWALGHYRVNTHGKDDGKFDGATYTLHRHQPPDAYDPAGRTPEQNNVSINRYSPKSLKTSHWEDPGGTVFMFDAWQPYSWDHSMCTNMQGPMISYKWWWGRYYDSALDPDGTKWKAAVRLWEERHLDKASILFCDGHTAAMQMIDTVGPVKNNIYFRSGVGTIITGMWTRYAGD